MEFTYRINAVEYREAAKLVTKSLVKTILRVTSFILISLLSLVPLTGFLARSGYKGGIGAVLGQAAEPILIIGFLVFILFLWPKLRLRKMYKRDPSFTGEFTAEITPEVFRRRSTVGALVQIEWKLMKYWREGRDLIVFVNHANCFTILSVAALRGDERQELRGILRAALPEKK